MSSSRILTGFNRLMSAQPPFVVYVMMFISVFIGFCFVTGLIVGPSQSVLYETGVLFDRHLWGALLLVTSSSVIAGFVTLKTSFIKFGGMGGFLVWLFACISLAISGHWYVFVTVGLFHFLIHSYVYLAETTGDLRGRG